MDDPPHDPLEPDPTNPPHYRQHPSGVECITVAEHMTFNLGNAMKYIWRFPHTADLDDLHKAMWYINREIERHAAAKHPSDDHPRPPLHTH